MIRRILFCSAILISLAKQEKIVMGLQKISETAHKLIRTKFSLEGQVLL